MLTTVSLAVTTLATTVATSDVVVDRIFLDDLGQPLPESHVVLRVSWQAGSADDQLVGVIGRPEGPLSISVDGGTFFDSTHRLATDRPALLVILGFPGFAELGYDSWFTIGNSALDVGPDWPSGSPFQDEVITADGTTFDAGGTSIWTGGPAGPDDVGWTVPPSQQDPGNGVATPSPQTVAGHWSGERVLFLQLALLPDDKVERVRLQGSATLILILDGEAVFRPVTFAWSGSEAPACPADLNGDGAVDVADLIQVITLWGTNDPAGDVNGDGLVGASDLIDVILAWGNCP